MRISIFPSFAISVKIISNAFLSKKSSESAKVIHSPVTTFNPAFRAADTPAFFWWITVIRESLAAYWSQMLGQLSKDPSLIRISSKSSKDWPRILSIHRDKYFSTLYTGTITDKNIFSPKSKTDETNTFCTFVINRIILKILLWDTLGNFIFIVLPGMEIQCVSEMSTLHILDAEIMSPL